MNHDSSMNESRCTVYGFNRYTEIDLGNLNILISVPHDGPLKPPGIQDREKDQNGNFKNDLNTRKIAKILRDELTALFLNHTRTQAMPFVIYNNLHRLKMDPNRSLVESCCDEESEIAYNDYHQMIETYFGEQFMLNNSKKSFTQGLLIDLHGQCHEENWIELGYLLSSNDLKKELNTPYARKKSSLEVLALQTNQSIETLIRGDHLSLGSIMEQQGFPVVPSPRIPAPNGLNYYSGGFITERYTCKELSKYRLNAIQIELPAKMREASILEMYARKIALCIFKFYHVNSFDKFLG